MPHNIVFFLWRVLKKMVPTDDVLRKMGIPIVSKCWCSGTGTEKTLDHLFLIAPTTLKLWRHFVSCASFSVNA